MILRSYVGSESLSLGSIHISGRVCWNHFFQGSHLRSGKGFTVSKAGDITNLSHKLWIKRGTDTVHCHDNRVFGQSKSSFVHFQTEEFHGFKYCVQHRYILPYQHLCVVIFWKHSNQVRGETANFLRLVRTEVIASVSAQALIIPIQSTGCLIRMSKSLGKL